MINLELIMKKFYFCVAALAIAAIGCNKVEEETDNTTPAEQPTKENVVYLSANLPEFVDTKATVSEAGVFAWEDGDVISVLCKNVSTNSTYKDNFYYVDFTYNAAKGMFACDLANASSIISTYPELVEAKGPYTIATAEEMQSQTDPFAIYPAQRVATTGINYDEIGKRFKMEGTLATDGSINFVHKSSLFKIPFKNVPTFASTIKVTGGVEEVTVQLQDINNDPINGDFTAYVPITPSGAAADITFSVIDSANNVIISKKKNANIAAGTLYTTPAISVNRYIVFNNSNNNTHRLGLGKRTDSMDWAGDWATFDMTTASGVKYFILPDEYSYPTVPGIQVELRQDDGGGEYAKSTATFMVPVRNLVFDVSENSLKTSYRCYAKFSDSQWGYWKLDSEIVKFRWGYGSRPDIAQPAVSNSDAICTEVEVASGKLFYYEFPDSMYGYNNVYWGFYNPVNYSLTSDWDNATINSDMQKIM